MVASRRDIYEAPAKSPWNFERYDSDLERRMMEFLDGDPEVAIWQKRHGITIPWIDAQGRRHAYSPDFLVQYADGRKVVIEVKNPELIESSQVRRKAEAAKRWCERRGMDYEIRTV